MKLKYN